MAVYITCTRGSCIKGRKKEIERNNSENQRDDDNEEDEEEEEPFE